MQRRETKSQSRIYPSGCPPVDPTENAQVFDDKLIRYSWRQRSSASGAMECGDVFNQPRRPWFTRR